MDFSTTPAADHQNLSSNANSVHHAGDFQPPEPLTGDYVEMGYLTVVFCLGIPINGLVFWRQLVTYRSRRAMEGRDLKTAYLLQKLNLNFANFLMLLVYCPVMIGWLWTYRWLGGDFLCRLTRFLWTLAYHLSSNMVAAVALDRLVHVCGLETMFLSQNFSRLHKDYLTPVKKLLFGSWLISVIFSVPQMFIFCNVKLAPDWYQCTTVWHRKRFIQDYHKINADGTFEQYDEEVAYLILHLITIFWAPFAVVLCSYCVIVFKVCMPSFAEGPGKTQHDGENERCEMQSMSSEKMLATARHSLYIAHPEMEQLSMPNWRMQLRGKMFCTTALVTIAFCILWLPYNILSFMIFLNPALARTLSDHANWLKGLILLNAVLNPFFYGESN